MHIFHKWSMWKKFEVEFDFYPRDRNRQIGSIPSIKMFETWQERTCIKCGYTVQEKIGSK